MSLFEPHIHMVSRTTDDYEAMALAGIRKVSEPAFWAGYDRATAAGFADYFRQLTETEPARAARYGIEHWCWICLNPKEAEDLALARDVLAIIPEFLDHPHVLGVGEIGLNKNSRNEIEVLEQHIEIAAQRNELILVHTPHLEDKAKGTRFIMDAVANQPKVAPERVLIDHCEEHTVAEVLDRGHWAGLTLYPQTKNSPERAADQVECYGTERLWVASAADWGASDPLAVPRLAAELRRRDHTEELIQRLLWDNPHRFLGQSKHFKR